MYVLAEDGLGRLRLVRARPWRRVLARLRSDGLDRELAAGRRPEASVALAVRAVQITAGPYRCDLSYSLRHITDAVPVAPGPAYAARAGAARRVRKSRQARAALDELAGALTAPGGVPVRAVAMTCVLLADGAGPLYNPARARELPGAVAKVLRSVRDIPAEV